MPERRITADDLRRWCLDNSHCVTPDDAVHEATAALILDRSPGTVANWRANGGASLPWFRSGRTGRVRYRLSDLADYLEAQRCEA
jgi:hypothetical protein